MPTALNVAWKDLPQEALREAALCDEHPRGALELFHPCTGVFLIRAAGHLTLASTERWIAAFMPLYETGEVFDYFLDWELVTGYDSEARKYLTDHVAKLKRSVRSIRFVTGNPIVRMGVQVASIPITFAGLHLETLSREKFSQALAERCR